MKKIIRWFFGVLLLFSAVASFALSFPAGICLFAAGLILLPPVSRRIPQFKGRKLVLSVGCVVLALMGIVYMSETESETVAERQEPPEATETETAETETAETEAAETEAAETEKKEDAQETVEQEKEAEQKEEEKEKEEKEETKPLDEEEFAVWMEKKISQDEEGEISDDEKQEWTGASEDEFFKVWSSAVFNEVDSMQENYEEIGAYAKKAETLYRRFYAQGDKIAEFDQYIDAFTDAGSKNKTLAKKYSFDLEKASTGYTTADFYITQRLDITYTDDIVGKIQKGMDGLMPDEDSCWAAYDVTYAWNNSAMPGDMAFVIYANSLNTFPQAGVYTLTYYDTGETAGLVDERGFVKDTPVYQLIENEAEFSVDAAEYAANLDICQSNYSQFLWALEKDRYENIQADAEAIDPMELSGGYAGGGNTYSVSMFSSMDSGNWAGTFMVGGESGDLYLLNGNLYTAEILSQKYVLGFSRQGDKVLMDVYVDGEAVGSAEMTERYES